MLQFDDVMVLNSKVRKFQIDTKILRSLLFRKFFFSDSYETEEEPYENDDDFN